MSLAYNHITQHHKSSYQEIQRFLEHNDLLLDPNVADFIEVRRDSELVACGGLDGNVIKCVAIDPSERGSGISLSLMGELQKLAMENGAMELFLFTKPDNENLFKGAGFYPVIKEEAVLLMENSQDRLANYCKELAGSQREGKIIGSIVLNANPFTLGHRYLIEKSLKQCDWLHVFVVKENLSFFSYEDRFQLVKKGIEDLAGITLHEGSDYIISRASFPNYFLKETNLVTKSHAGLDLMLFRRFIAPALNIHRRFVGTEPTDLITQQYNKEMAYYLSEKEDNSAAIEVIEIPRTEISGQAISASKVRSALKDQNFELIKGLVPVSTYDFLVTKYG